MADKVESTTEKEMPARRRPSNIPRLVERNDPAIIRQAHKSFYGFDVSDQWATDLAAYVAKPGKVPQMLASGDPETVQGEIQSVYGFAVTRQYAVDLLAFSEKEEASE